jgi:4-carboxymuconolactone decarboxylase
MSKAYRQGLEEISRIDPEYGTAFIEELKQVSPDFADYLVEFAFGKIYARTVLDPKAKELIAIANLTSIGQGSTHLKLAILGAIRVGCTREEITEVVIQSIIYVGFMRALAALHLIKEVYEEEAAAIMDSPRKNGQQHAKDKEKGKGGAGA